MYGNVHSIKYEKVFLKPHFYFYKSFTYTYLQWDRNRIETEWIVKGRESSYIQMTWKYYPTKLAEEKILKQEIDL